MRSKLLFLIVLIAALAALPGIVQANLVYNPGFEDQNSDNNPWLEDLYPDQWDGWSAGGSRAWKETGGVSGACLELTSTGTGVGSGQYAWPAGTGATSDIPIDNAKQYYFGIKAKGGSNLDIKIEFYATDGASGEGNPGDVAGTYPTGPSWGLIQIGPVDPPSTANFVRFVIINWTAGTTVSIDDAWVETYPPGNVSNPTPANGAKQQAPALIDLKWKHSGTGLSDVWWDDGSADVNDLNFQWHMDNTSEVVQIGASLEPNEVTNKSIVIEKNYHWRVDNGGKAGPVWMFSTVNDPPEVDAGLKQAMWLPSGGGSVTFQLAPTVSDDGLPDPPSTVTYLWTATDPCNPGAVVFTPGGATSIDPNATATMTVTGDYIIDLAVSDSTLVGSDSVKLRVHANATTGLEARYDCQEIDSAWGIHDDYSGAEKNPTGTYPNFDYSNGTRRGERMDNIGDFNTSVQGTNNTTLDTTGGHNARPEQDPCDLALGGIIFDGGTGHVKIANSTNGDPNYNPWSSWPGPSWADFEDEVTLAAWIKVDPDNGGWDNNWESIIVKGYPGAYRLERNAGTDGVQFSIDIAGSYSEETGTYDSFAAYGGMNVNDGEWHHVVGTYDGAHVCIYVDGIEDDCVETGGTQMALNGGPLTIGLNYQTDTPQAFGGIMDEIRIHSIGLPHASDDPEGTGNPEAGPLDGNNARSVLSIYRTTDGHVSCVDENGDTYLTGDVNHDCYVDIKDIKQMAQEWLECNDIGNVRNDCDPYGFEYTP